MIRRILEKTGVLAVVIEAVRQDEENKLKAKEWRDSLSPEDIRLLLLARQDSHFRKWF